MSQFKNFAWLTSTKILTLAITLIVTGFSARYLGVENFGVLALAISFANLFNALVSMGLPHLLSSKFVSHPRSAESTLIAAGIVRFSFTSILYPILLITFWFSYNDIFWVLLVSTLGSFFYSLDVFEIYYDSKGKSKYQAIPHTISKTFAELYKVFLINFNASLFWFSFFLPIWFGLSLFLRFYNFSKTVKGLKIRQLKVLALYLLKSSLPLVLSTMSIIIYMQSDKIMIESMLGKEELGLYAAASSLSNAWLIIPTSIVITLLPSVIKKLKKNKNLEVSVLIPFFRLVFFISILIAFVIYMLSDLLILFVFGPAYSYSSTLLNIMLITACLSVYGMSANRILIAIGMRKFCMYKTIFAAILNIFANYFLIKEFGLIGATLSTMLAEICASLFLNFFVSNSKVGISQVMAIFSVLSFKTLKDLNKFINKKYDI